MSSDVLWAQMSKYFPQLKPGGDTHTLLLLQPVIRTNNVLCFGATVIININHVAKCAFFPAVFHNP